MLSFVVFCEVRFTPDKLLTATQYKMALLHHNSCIDTISKALEQFVDSNNMVVNSEASVAGFAAVPEPTVHTTMIHR